MQGTAYSYQHPPEALSLESTSIEWEQSIIEGHPTHPVRRDSMTYDILMIYLQFKDAQVALLRTSYT